MEHAVAGSIVDSGNFDWTADPQRQPLFNEPDASYGGGSGLGKGSS